MRKGNSLFLALLLMLTAFSIQTAHALDTPTGLTATGNRGGDYNSGTVTLSWNAVAAADSGYAIQTLLNDVQVGSLTGVLGQGTTSVTVSGLQGGSTYSFKVRAISSSAVSAWSSAVTAMPITSPSTPAKPTHTTSRLDATVRWTAPLSDGGAGITSYVVTEANTGRTQSVSSTTFSALFSAFASGSKVKFNVRAINGVTVEGTTSANSDETTLPNVPNKVVGVTVSKTSENDQLRVTWEIPGNGGSVLTGFEVFLRQSGADIQTAQVTDIEATSTLFSGLAAGTYSAQVLAKNVIGSGSRSNEPAGIDVAGTTPAVAASTPSGGGGGGGGSGGGSSGGGSSGGTVVVTTSTPSPTPTPSPSPSTSASASPTPTPSQTASPKPTLSPSPTPRITPKPSETSKVVPATSKSPTAKSSSKSSPTPSPISVIKTPVSVATSITKSIDVKGAITKVLDSKGKPLSGIKVAISKSGKVIATFPKGTKTGTYTVRVITKSKKVINLSVKVVKK